MSNQEPEGLDKNIYVALFEQNGQNVKYYALLVHWFYARNAILAMYFNVCKGIFV